MNKALIVMMGMMALAGFANEVPVVMQSGVDGSVIEEREIQTGTTLTSVSAPMLSGYIFTGWMSSDAAGLVARDRLGRSMEVAQQMVYGETCLTANYLAEDIDSDGDGIADGYEYYWYGDLDETASSDTDGDGYTFAEEIAAGTDPLMADHSVVGGIVWDDGVKVQYNPKGIPHYTIRSEPEGALFETIVAYVKPGTKVTTESYATDTLFSYWTTNGVRVADRFGRAKNAVTFTMGGEPIEVVAVCEEDEALRHQLYWYGSVIDMTSDTDGDGYTFAEEIAAGTDPLMADHSVVGGIVWDDGVKVQYNPKGLQQYVIRSEPEGVLFASITNIVSAGTKVTTESYATDTLFSYWTTNGVRVADRFGRAKNAVTFTMGGEPIEVVAVCEEDEALRHQLYWYGSVIDMTSDTDGDGYTFAEEIAAGTDPLMADHSVVGGIVWDNGKSVNINFQLYEQVRGVVVDGRYEELFFCPYVGNAATSRTFGSVKGQGEGAQIWPVVGDVNGDGLWDLIVVSDVVTNVFVNVGSNGNPQFSEKAGVKSEDMWKIVDLNMNTTAKLAEMTIDIEPECSLSATTNGVAMLVSDANGRIWYYLCRSQLSTPTYSLQHKVWGGSFDGFANGLTLAAVDWDDDGDLDCICGTAEGKLMLLRDPRSGRPTNLQALAGVDNVLLNWDPNVQSHVKGYRVFREDGVKIGSEGEQWKLRDFTSLPTYRDIGMSAGEYGYRVTSISRFYTAGNSTPKESESEPSETVRADVGMVNFHWGELVLRDDDGMVEQVLSIENSFNYDATGLVISNVYDVCAYTFIKVEASGISEGLSWEVNAEDGLIVLTITGGAVAAGGGTFFTFIFDPVNEDEDEVVKGDLDGDGELTRADLEALAKLIHSWNRKPTEDELAAGDYNHNGRLDPGDYILMRLHFIHHRIIEIGERIKAGGEE